VLSLYLSDLKPHELDSNIPLVSIIVKYQCSQVLRQGALMELLYAFGAGTITAYMRSLLGGFFVFPDRQSKGEDITAFRLSLNPYPSMM